MSAGDQQTVTKGVRPQSRFVGHFTNKIDAKGRLSIPADLRKHITPHSSEPSPVMFCCPSLLDSELICGGDDLTVRLLKVVETTDLFSKNRRRLERAIHAHTQRLYFDDTGRVSLPKVLRDHAGLAGQVTIIGQGQTFVMQAPDDFDDFASITASLSDEDREVLATRSLPSIMAQGDDQ